MATKKKKTTKKEKMKPTKKSKRIKKKLEKQENKKKIKTSKISKKIEKKNLKLSKKLEKKENKKKHKANKISIKLKKKLEKQENKKKIKKTEEEKEKIKIRNKNITLVSLFSLVIAVITLLFTTSMKSAGIGFIISFGLIETSIFIKKIMKKSERIRKMEEVFPDFVELMASNLRAGMTIDRALLLSSREEFAPLDKEVLKLGKEIATGKEINQALLSMAERINSEKITKTITVINSGIRSGGNLAILLEKTAMNMREKGFIEKRAASNVLMYVIFIFFAVAIGAPLLFSLSAVLVQVLSNILVELPTIETTSMNLPLTLTSINISATFITYFSMIFLILIDILAALLLGLINKGEEKAGLKYAIPLIIISILTFFIVKTFIAGYFSNLI